MAQRCFYEILGVSRTCSDADLKSAFRKQAVQHHPDKNPGDRAAEAKFKEINEAYQILSDGQKHFAYNAAIRQTMGHIATLRGDAKMAAQHFNEASLLAPDDDRILEDLARAQMACGDFADAEVNLARLLEYVRDQLGRLKAANDTPVTTDPANWTAP